MTTRPPTSAHLALMDDLKAALAKHTHLSGAEMLAMTSQLVGNLIAAQDQRKWTPERVMESAAQNIELGNAADLEILANPAGVA